MAGAVPERQERGVIQAIKQAIKKNKNNPITVVAGKTSISNVMDAAKFSGRHISGKEPYTDVQFVLKNNKRINLSLKGEAAPSLAGGGLSGLEQLIPNIVNKFMTTAYKQLVADGLKAGDKVPDVYGKISRKDKEKIVIGNLAIGGPVDYMYIGPMDVKYNYDINTNKLTFYGAAITPTPEYARTHELYFRLRARREDQRFDPDAKRGSVPKIYGVSPSRGDSAGRIVITDSVPKNAKIISL